MDNRMVRFKLTVAHGKCLNCGTERILYFTSNGTYGERIVSTRSGKKCAYANILNENIMQELEKMYRVMFGKWNKYIAK